ncbi:unnamed protein product, partial [Staurois parvus]
GPRPAGGPRQLGEFDVGSTAWRAITGTNPLYGSLCSSLALTSSPLSLLLAFSCCRENHTGDRFQHFPPLLHPSSSMYTICFPQLPKPPLLLASLLSFPPPVASTQ